MHVSMSTLSWLTFPPPEDDVPQAPYSAAPLEPLLDAAVAADFEAVGLDNVVLGARLLEPEGRAEVVEAVRARGLTVTDIGVLRIGTADARTQARATAELAEALSVPCCMAIVDAPVTDAVIDEVRACARIVAEGGARLDLEFMAYGPVPTLRDCLTLTDAVGHDLCGLVVDSWHLFHGDPDWTGLRSLPADRIGLVQVSDGAGRAAGPDEFFAASRWGRVPPGAGVFDFDPFQDALGACGFAGPIAPEVLSFGAAVADAAVGADRLRASMRRFG